MTTPHQPENGYENATDEEKKTMMLKIAKEANAEQKAMFERTCLCKDKGVIELIEEAVEAERARIREGVEGLARDTHGLPDGMPPMTYSYNQGLLDALQVINKQEGNPQKSTRSEQMDVEVMYNVV